VQRRRDACLTVPTRSPDRANRDSGYPSWIRGTPSPIHQQHAEEICRLGWLVHDTATVDSEWQWK